MQSKDLHQIKAAIRDQAFLGTARVFCIMGPVVAARHRKGSTGTRVCSLFTKVPSGER